MPLLLAAGALYAVWYALTYFTAGLITNNAKGYRPWQWGMVPRNEHGQSARRFDIPLTHSEAFEAFLEPSDPRVQQINHALSAEQSEREGDPTSPI